MPAPVAHGQPPFLALALGVTADRLSTSGRGYPRIFERPDRARAEQRQIILGHVGLVLE
jgi:hypothetical protein